MHPAASFCIRSPATDIELEAYFKLRWQLLRAPWQQPPGSERDALEHSAFHLLAQDLSGRIIGVARLHELDDTRGQIRYMAVSEDCRGQGVGKALLEGLESEARRRGISGLVLHARENAVAFYRHHGYEIVGPSHTLFDTIPHMEMRKHLQNNAAK